MDRLGRSHAPIRSSLARRVAKVRIFVDEQNDLAHPAPSIMLSINIWIPEQPGPCGPTGHIPSSTVLSLRSFATELLNDGGDVLVTVSGRDRFFEHAQRGCRC